MMRKRIFVFMAFVLLTALFSVPLKAQGDGFFSNYQSGERSGDAHYAEGAAFAEPMHNTKVPLGGGMLVLTIGGVGYVLLKKNKKEENK